MEKFRSGINIPDTQHCLMIYFFALCTSAVWDYLRHFDKGCKQELRKDPRNQNSLKLSIFNRIRSLCSGRMLNDLILSTCNFIVNKFMQVCNSFFNYRTLKNKKLTWPIFRVGSWARVGSETTWKARSAINWKARPQNNQKCWIRIRIRNKHLRSTTQRRQYELG